MTLRHRHRKHTHNKTTTRLLPCPLRTYPDEKPDHLADHLQVGLRDLPGAGGVGGAEDRHLEGGHHLDPVAEPRLLQGGVHLLGRGFVREESRTGSFSCFSTRGMREFSPMSTDGHLFLLLPILRRLLRRCQPKYGGAETRAGLSPNLDGGIKAERTENNAAHTLSPLERDATNGVRYRHKRQPSPQRERTCMHKDPARAQKTPEGSLVCAERHERVGGR